ncbi:hypothetical protein AXF42_Ash000088 [Apostasia shenzhenica]|uniref:Uncharacterized protein n=1 Tax=Apostasia shenzhenica TaxID=1088818 RepID=A0A2I0AFF9_9ASPA|nr:hypothetical protein AXF42_Ash000088 [Apostasia shenzhenica]
MSKRHGRVGDRLLSRCARAPIRALCLARDFYIKSMTGCAGRMHYSAPAAPMAGGGFSRSSSYSCDRFSSSDEDLRELIRAASLSKARAAAAAEGSVRRSQSVAAVRIDEDQPYDFAGELKVGGSLIFPRSRSYAVGGKAAGAGAGASWKYK